MKADEGTTPNMIDHREKEGQPARTKKASASRKLFLELEKGSVLYIWAWPSIPNSPHAFQRLPLEALPRVIPAE